mmetsp:Transcript_30065/g.34422  ORF Transcript_30065/g.34422 Transcript_30065/m.34422 type:complete len:89 (+) Transcript_30065:436-702(+)
MYIDKFIKTGDKGMIAQVRNLASCYVNKQAEYFARYEAFKQTLAEEDMHDTEGSIEITARVLASELIERKTIILPFEDRNLKLKLEPG